MQFRSICREAVKARQGGFYVRTLFRDVVFGNPIYL